MALNDKIIVVTGAARGIGRAFAEGFLEKGAKVVGLDLTWSPTGASNDENDEWVQTAQSHDDMLALACDITREEDIQSAYEQTLAKFGTVDVLCNVAGLLQRHLFPPGGPVKIIGETSNDDFRKMYDVTVFGTLAVTRKFVQPMIKQKRGSIINMASSGVCMRAEGGAFTLFRADSREQPYMSAKSALVNLMCYMGEELREDNVAVNVMVPLHTRSTGYDEWHQAAEDQGMPHPPPYHPNHVQPLACFLAEQDAASGNTAKIWMSRPWLTEHGHPLGQWLAP